MLPIRRGGRPGVVVALVVDGAGRVAVVVHQKDAPRVAVRAANRRLGVVLDEANLDGLLNRLIPRRVRHLENGVVNAGIRHVLQTRNRHAGGRRRAIAHRDLALAQRAHRDGERRHRRLGEIDRARLDVGQVEPLVHLQPLVVDERVREEGVGGDGIVFRPNPLGGQRPLAQARLVEFSDDGIRPRAVGGIATAQVKIASIVRHAHDGAGGSRRAIRVNRKRRAVVGENEVRVSGQRVGIRREHRGRERARVAAPHGEILSGGALRMLNRPATR